jgi:hypothetical protein
MLVAFPTMALRPGSMATEEDAPDPSSAGGGRAPSEAAALALASIGVKSTVVRLPPNGSQPAEAGIGNKDDRDRQKERCFSIC